MIRMTACILGLSLGSVAPALAEAPSTAALYACAEKADDAERLACYDAAVGRLKTAEEAGEITTVSREQVEKVQRESFGFSIPSLPAIALPRLGGGDGEDREIDEITEAVASVAPGPDGKLRVRLENGQVWRQVDTTSVYLSRRNPPEAALIRRAALGSFRMKLDNGIFFRVTREQ